MKKGYRLEVKILRLTSLILLISLITIIVITIVLLTNRYNVYGIEDIAFVQIDNCSKLSSNRIYELSNDITTNKDCFMMNSVSNIEFRCKNSTHQVKHKITGDGDKDDDAFLIIDSDNITIKDCKIINLNGIKITNHNHGGGLSFYNNLIIPNKNQYGYIEIGASTNSSRTNYIHNNTFNSTSSVFEAIKISNGNYKHIENNIVYARKGMNIDKVNYSWIMRNKIFLKDADPSRWGYGIRLDNSNNFFNISNNAIRSLDNMYYYGFVFLPKSDIDFNYTDLNNNNTFGNIKNYDKFYYYYKERNNTKCNINHINLTNYAVSNVGKILIVDTNYCSIDNLIDDKNGNVVGGFAYIKRSNHTKIVNSRFRNGWSASEFGTGLSLRDDNRNDGLWIQGSNNISIYNVTLHGSRDPYGGTFVMRVNDEGFGGSSNTQGLTFNHVYQNLNIMNCKKCLTFDLPSGYDIKIFDSNFSHAYTGVINGIISKNFYINNSVIGKVIDSTRLMVFLDGNKNFTFNNNSFLANDGGAYSIALLLGSHSSNLTNINIKKNIIRDINHECIIIRSGNNTPRFRSTGILNISQNYINGCGDEAIRFKDYYGKAYFVENKILRVPSGGYKCIALEGQHNYTEITRNFCHTYANGIGVGSSFSINNTNISKNTIVGLNEYGSYGIFLTGSNVILKDNIVYNNNRSYNQVIGYYVSSSINGVTIERNMFNDSQGYNYGFAVYKDNLSLGWNYCYGNSYCLNPRADNIRFENSYMENVASGLYVYNSNNIDLNNSTIKNPIESCIYIWNDKGGNNLYVNKLNCILSDKLLYSIYSYLYNRTEIYNSTLSDGILYFENSYDNIFLNTTFDIRQQQLINSNLNVSWYLKFNVTTNQNVPVDNARVNVSDMYGNYQIKNTSSNGLTSLFIVNSIILGENGKDFNNVTINVTKPLYIHNSTTLNITSSQSMWMFIKFKGRKNLSSFIRIIKDKN